MSRVILLTLVIFGIMVRSLLSQDLDLDVYKVRPNVVLEIPNELTQGSAIELSGDTSIGEADMEDVGMEVELEDPSLEPWEIEQLLWEQELIEDGAFGC